MWEGNLHVEMRRDAYAVTLPFPHAASTHLSDLLILVAVLDVAIKRLILASAFPEFADSVGEEITEQGYLFWKGRGHNGKSMYGWMGILLSLPCFSLSPTHRSAGKTGLCRDAERHRRPGAICQPIRILTFRKSYIIKG